VNYYLGIRTIAVGTTLSYAAFFFLFGKTQTMDGIIAGLGAAAGFAALHVANDYVLKGMGLGCLCPPLGAVAVLLFCLPGAPASQPKAVIGAHIIAGVIGYAVLQSGVAAYGEAIAVSLTIAAMSATKMVHPPAGAYAFLYVNKGMGLKGILAPGLVGAVILITTQQVFNATLLPLLSGGKKKKS
jgi:CBS-domain-containing membrane protein